MPYGFAPVLGAALANGAINAFGSSARARDFYKNTGRKMIWYKNPLVTSAQQFMSEAAYGLIPRGVKKFKRSRYISRADLWRYYGIR